MKNVCQVLSMEPADMLTTFFSKESTYMSETSLRVKKQNYHPALLKKNVFFLILLLSSLTLFLLTMHPFSYEGLLWEVDDWTTEVWSHENTMNYNPRSPNRCFKFSCKRKQIYGKWQIGHVFVTRVQNVPPKRLMNRFLIAFCAEQVMGFWATNGFWWHIQMIRRDSKVLKESQRQVQI